MASSFMKFVVFTYMLEASIILWNSIGIFGVNNILSDNSNTVQGVLSGACGSSNVNALGQLIGCNNLMTLGIVVLSLIGLGSGIITVLAFGNTFFAFGLYITFATSIATLYNPVTAILDQFTTVYYATALGGLIALAMTFMFIEGIIKIQAKVDI